MLTDQAGVDIARSTEVGVVQMRPEVRRVVGLATAGRARTYGVSRPAQSLLVLGGISVAVAAVGAQYAIKAYNAMPKEKPQEAAATGGGGGGGEAEKEQPRKGRRAAEQQQQTKAQEGGSSSSVNANMESIFASWGGSWTEFKKSFFTKGFYDGGFEDKMSKREAALILGVRESTSPDRIKEAHRRVLLLNHPDRGGSAYIAAKINEAKDLLLKGTGTK